MKAEMHKKGAKYSYFHLKLYFLRGVLVMAYTLCENWRGCSDSKNFGLMKSRAFALNTVTQEYLFDAGKDLYCRSCFAKGWHRSVSEIVISECRMGFA